MKYIILLATIITITSCSKIETLTLSNSSSRTLVNQPIVIPRSSLTVPVGKYLLMKGADNQPIPLQHDDLDKDGQWDEIAFQIDFEPQEKLSILYEWVEADKIPEFEKRTNIYLGYSPNLDKKFVSIPEHTRPKDHVAQSTPFLYQAEGPMWESELVAFRTYFDSRNGKDIFGKTKPALNAHIIGNGANYHELQEWGMDVLKVGNSLGAGAIAMLKDDSLYRLSNTAGAKFETIATGPVRSIMKLTYNDWQVKDTNYDLIEKISIWAGKRHYESELVLSGGNETDTLVTGIVNLKNLPPRVIKTEDRSMLYTHGKQSENKDALGMALIIPKVNCYDFTEAPEEGQGVTNTYTAYLKSTDGTYRYAFVAGWELENAQLKAEDYFNQELKNTTTAQNGLITLKQK